jgi:hypothetical protein
MMEIEHEDHGESLQSDTQADLELHASAGSLRHVGCVCTGGLKNSKPSSWNTSIWKTTFCSAAHFASKETGK